jgi:actin-like ATPase involved in cell morphogenesis
VDLDVRHRRLELDKGGRQQARRVIASYVRRKYNLLIGEQTAEEIKIEVGSALPLEEPRAWKCAGATRSPACPHHKNHLPEITDAISEPLAAIAASVKIGARKDASRTGSDISDRGYGDGRRRRLAANMDRYLTKRQACPVTWLKTPAVHFHRRGSRLGASSPAAPRHRRHLLIATNANAPILTGSAHFGYRAATNNN